MQIFDSHAHENTNKKLINERQLKNNDREIISKEKGKDPDWNVLVACGRGL